MLNKPQKIIMLGESSNPILIQVWAKRPSYKHLSTKSFPTKPLPPSVPHSIAIHLSTKMANKTSWTSGTLQVNKNIGLYSPCITKTATGS
jgi:hypothetical protein